MNTTETINSDRVSTGIEGLDYILKGGLPQNRLCLLQENPGTGKTTMALQFLLDGEAKGETSLYITLSESFDELIAVGKSHDWDLSAINICDLTVSGDTLFDDSRYTVFHPSEVEMSKTTKAKGIKPEFLPFVFERFRQADNSYTRQVGGLGLGLAIVRHLVEQHGGAISVESAGENCGAAFTFTLPIAIQNLESNSEPKIIAAVPPIENMKTPNLRILLVEDDEDSREMLKVMFEQNGMEISGVSSAAEAVEIFKRFKPDVLISDIGLPDEDGYELIGKVRRLSPEDGGLTPAVALTGYVSQQDRRHAFDAGYQEHLSKPVDIDKLLDLVKELASRGELAQVGNP